MEVIKKIIKKIESYNNIALFMHVQPDGDSISSAYGLALALQENYPEKNIKVVSDYDYLKENFSLLKLKRNMFIKKIDDSYLAIVGDVSIKSRVLKFEEFSKAKENIVFDHHLNESNIENSIFWHEPKYPASSLQAAEIALYLKDTYKEETAIKLLFGILTDTGFFRYSNNFEKAPLIYSKLISFTSSKAMNDLFIQMSKKSMVDIEIQRYIFDNLKFKKNVSYVYFDNNFVKKYGYVPIKMKLNSIANIDDKDVWAFFVEVKEEKTPIKVSIRSSRRDVQKIATKHSGGGHFKASGAKAFSKKEVQKIIDELTKAKKL